MSINPLVSVIIPTYNRASYVIQAIGSVLDQTYKNYEIIVIDDGSTDNTKDLLGPYIKREEIRYIYQKNKKPPAARNAGIKNSKGVLIAILDSDDLWMPDKLEKQVPLFNDNDVGVVYGDRLKWNVISNEAIGTPYFNKFSRGYIFDKLFDNTKSFLPHSSLVIRKSCLDKIILCDGNSVYSEDPALETTEDYHLLLRITHKFKVDFVPEILVKKRIHNENESKNKINNIMATIVTIKDISNKLNVPEYKLKYNLSKYYMSIGYNYRKTNKLIAMKYYFLSLSYNVSSEQIRLIASLFGSMFNLRNSVIKKG